MQEENYHDEELENSQEIPPENFDYSGSVIGSYDESLARSRFKTVFNRAQAPVLFVAFITFLNGLTLIYLPLFQKLARHPHLFDLVIPYDLYHWSRGLSIMSGFFLIYLAFNLAARKRMSYWLAISGLSFSLLLHLLRARIENHADSDFINQSLGLAVLPILINLFLLVQNRKRFRVKSEPGKIWSGIYFFFAALVLAIVYGSLGFWLLDRSEFGMNFQVGDAVYRTIREFLLLGNSDLHARTAYASWFLDSIRMAGAAAAVFAAYSLFRPIEYSLRARPIERKMAADLLDKYGRDALDYYKLLPDKSYLFSASGNCFLAYKTSLSVAINLGDLIGKDEEASDFVQAFTAWAHENGWLVAFMQTGEHFLEAYKANALSVLKIGEDAVVDLDKFVNQTIKKKDFKSRARKFEKDGFSFEEHSPPHAESLLDEVEAVSKEWLSLPGRRERSFSLGVFDREILKQDKLFVVKSAGGKILAFVNQVRSYAESEASIDLMRHRREVPNGTMDYLFVKLLPALHKAGFKRFNLGLAALSGVGEGPDANLHEKAAHQIYEHMNRFFSYKGLRNYKNKFEPEWQSRYLVYEGGTAGLLKTALAILEATEA